MAIFKKPQSTESRTGDAANRRHLIMLVDDEPANLTVLSSVLEDEFDLVCANNGADALKMIAEMPDTQRLRLVISDQRMPIMTGTELLTSLKVSHPHIIRILLTGYADIDAIMDGVNKAQLFRYICKPFDRNDMLMTVRRAIELFEAEEARKRAEETSNQHLQRINEVLSSTNRLKDLFLATVSHELRTPMHGVVGNLELMRQADLDEQVKGWLGEAIDSAQRMRELLDEILGYTELQTGTLKLNPAPVNLPALLQRLLAHYAAACEQKGLNFISNISADASVNIVTDAEQLSLILQHLLDNAVKFTDQGVVSLSVEVTKNQLKFTVKDSGRGIAETHLETLFERFQQGDQRFSRRYGGLGLGLAICRGLTQLFKGQLNVQSRIGEGSTFELVLPFEPVLDAAATPKKTEISNVSLKGLTVLAVDDNPVNLKVINAMLQRLGCETECASNGVEALDKLSTKAFQIILMDCQMPVMDGFEATQRIKSHVQYANVPIIAFTANASQRDWTRAQECGMCDLLKKPVTLQQLNDCLSKWFGHIVTMDANL